MSTSTTTLDAGPLGVLTPEQTSAAAERVAVVEGLRDLASAIEMDPRIPTPTLVVAGGLDVRTASAFEDAAAALASTATATTIGAVDYLPGTIEAAGWFGASVKLGVTVRADLVAEERTVERVEHVLPPRLARIGQPRYVIEDRGPGDLGQWAIVDTHSATVAAFRDDKEAAHETAGELEHGAEVAA